MISSRALLQLCPVFLAPQNCDSAVDISGGTSNFAPLSLCINNTWGIWQSI